MDTDQPPPPRVLWSLRRRRTEVRCILKSETRPVEVLVLHGGDRVLLERFASEELALLWADAYAGRLRALGWFDTSLPDLVD